MYDITMICGRRPIDKTRVFLILEDMVTRKLAGWLIGCAMLGIKSTVLQAYVCGVCNSSPYLSSLPATSLCMPSIPLLHIPHTHTHMQAGTHTLIHNVIHMYMYVHVHACSTEHQAYTTDNIKFTHVTHAGLVSMLARQYSFTVYSVPTHLWTELFILIKSRLNFLLLSSFNTMPLPSSIQHDSRHI